MDFIVRRGFGSVWVEKLQQRDGLACVFELVRVVVTRVFLVPGDVF